MATKHPSIGYRGTRIRTFLAIALAGSLAACGDEADLDIDADADDVEVVETPATPPAAPASMATVRIVEPAEGATVTTGPRVVLAADNIMILPAGDTTANSGHHHLLLNVPVPPTGEPIPAGQEGIVHLGQAQTEYTFEGLAPGEYTLVAVIGDLAHRVVPQRTDTVRFRVGPAPQ